MSRKYMFLDWTNIDPGYGTMWLNEEHPCCSPSGVRLRAHRPQLDTAPCFMPEMPWESKMLNLYSTVLKIDGKYRLWYECFTLSDEFDDMESFLCYAESDDGVHFTRPTLGIFDYCGSKENNIIMHAHGCCVLYDEKAPAEERYKLVHVSYALDDPNGHTCRVIGEVSPDGIHFTRLPEPILDNPADTLNKLTVDPGTGEYTLVTRQPYGFRSQRRSIAMTKSRDFAHFPPVEVMVNNDPLDPPDWDYYTNNYTPLPGAENAWVMAVNMYHRTEDSFDVHLFTSTDNAHWYRPMGRDAWVENGEEGAWNDKIVGSMNGLCETGDGKWVMYFGGARRGHNDGIAEYSDFPVGRYYRGVLREDGFMSLRADAKGEFFTLPFEVTGDRLKVNANIPIEGSIRVGLYDFKTEKYVPGFAPEDSDALTHGGVSLVASWHGNPDISQFMGRRLQVRFEMFKSDLYSFSM